MWELIDIICRAFDTGDTLAWWRFYACLILSFGLVCFVFWLISNQNLCVGISSLIAISGVATGLVWQLQKRAD